MLVSHLFDLNLEWNVKTLINFTSDTEIPLQSLEEIEMKLNNPVEDAHFLYKIAKARQAAETSKRLKPPLNVAESKIWTDNSLFKDA